MENGTEKGFSWEDGTKKGSGLGGWRREEEVAGRMDQRKGRWLGGWSTEKERAGRMKQRRDLPGRIEQRRGGGGRMDQRNGRWLGG